LSYYKAESGSAITITKFKRKDNQPIENSIVSTSANEIISKKTNDDVLPEKSSQSPQGCLIIDEDSQDSYLGEKKDLSRIY
jgi:hypothetical protein